MPLGTDFEGAYHKVLAVIISLLLLAMVILCLATLPFVRSVTWLKYRAIVMASGALLILLTAFRIILPTPFHEDFRHIFPILVPFCLLYAKVVERLRPWAVWLYRTGIGIALLMIASSVAFFARIP